MLERPDVLEETILAGAYEAYGLQAVQAAFLPLGADTNTAVYRLVIRSGEAYFLKLRKGPFDEIIIKVPLFLKSQGVLPIIAPLATRSNQWWGSLGEYKMILYPFIAGVDGYVQVLSEAQWGVLGQAMRSVHAAPVPQDLRQLIPQETFPAQFRQELKTFQAQVEQVSYRDPVSLKLVAFMKENRQEISRMIERTEALSREVQSRPLENVLCHADIHPGNVLISPDGAIFIVDWDNPILAPKERDLMFFGGNGLGSWHSKQEEAWFYQGYGPAEVDRKLLAYYRYARIIEDMALFAETLLLSEEGGEDREQSYLWFKSSFIPGHELDIAKNS